MVKRVAALPATPDLLPDHPRGWRGVRRRGMLSASVHRGDRAPILTHTASLFGHGIVGGPMFSTHGMG